MTFNIKFNRNATRGELEEFEREKSFFLHSKHLHSSNNTVNSPCGFWRNNRYHSYQQQQSSTPISMKHRPIKLTPVNKTNNPLNVLWIYGDSLGVRFLGSVKGHRLCREIFKKCRGTYTWTYRHYSRNYRSDKTLYTGADFNASKFLNDIKRDILQTELMTHKSAFVINFGLHVTMSLQLEKCFALFRSFLKMVFELRKEYGNENLPLIIWKSTTLPVFENARLWNVTHTRFLSKQVCFII